MSVEQPDVLDGAIAPAENSALFGHEAEEAFLAQSYRSGKGHHAILIEGPEGIGKATLAFRFANHVLSHPDPALAPAMLAEPDTNSAVSRQITSGASHNLLHLTRPVDEKSGRMKATITVDEVRRAGHFFAQTSGTGNWRIVIIDAADDLNRNAANAILKILEEPPKRAMFLVLSHAPGRLLPTIRSRCLPLKLSALNNADLSRALSHLGLDPGAKGQAVLERSEGSVAEAIKLINYGGLDIAEALADILASSGRSARQSLHKLADVLSGKDSEVIHGFFTSHLESVVAALAREAALAGDGTRAERLARLAGDIQERLRVSQAYNLDKKQTIIALIEDLLAAL